MAGNVGEAPVAVARAVGGRKGEDGARLGDQRFFVFA